MLGIHPWIPPSQRLVALRLLLGTSKCTHTHATFNNALSHFHCRAEPNASTCSMHIQGQYVLATHHIMVWTLESPGVIAFHPTSASTLYARGMRTDRVLHVFDLAIPGARASTVLRMGKTRRSGDGQEGLVSALVTCAADHSMMTVGTYAPGSLYLCDVRAGPVESGTITEGCCMVGHGRKNKRKTSSQWRSGQR